MNITCEWVRCNIAQNSVSHFCETHYRKLRGIDANSLRCKIGVQVFELSLRITLWTNVRRLKTTLDSVIDDRNISKQQSNAKKSSTIYTIGRASFEEASGLRSETLWFKMGKERVKSKNLFNFRPQGFLDKDIERFYEKGKVTLLWSYFWSPRKISRNCHLSKLYRLGSPTTAWPPGRTRWRTCQRVTLWGWWGSWWTRTLQPHQWLLTQLL